MAGVEVAIRAVIAAVEWVISKVGALGGILSDIPVSAAGPWPRRARRRADHQRPRRRRRILGGPAGLEINVNVAGNVGDPVVLGRRITEALRAYVEASGGRELRAVIGA